MTRKKHQSMLTKTNNDKKYKCITDLDMLQLELFNWFIVARIISLYTYITVQRYHGQEEVVQFTKFQRI